MLHGLGKETPALPLCHRRLEPLPSQSNQLDSMAYRGCEKSQLPAQCVNPAACASGMAGAFGPRSQIVLPPESLPDASVPSPHWACPCMSSKNIPITASTAPTAYSNFRHRLKSRAFVAIASSSHYFSLVQPRCGHRCPGQGRSLPDRGTAPAYRRALRDAPARGADLARDS
jgi:hypothetical protein